jgi:iron complex transport system substrate-binding protein
VNAVQTDLRGQTLSMETILALNPDIIVYAATGKKFSERDITENPVLRNTTAVKTGKVFLNPKGLFFWDRYSAEEALQIQWASQQFYPERFAGFDIVDETVYFFHTFFRYDLTREEALMIINGIPPTQ